MQAARSLATEWGHVEARQNLPPRRVIFLMYDINVNVSFVNPSATYNVHPMGVHRTCTCGWADEPGFD